MTKTEKQQIKSFLAGTSHTSYDYFGVHRSEEDFTFRVFAPKATRVMLTGDFNNWQEDIELRSVDESGIWEAIVPSDRIYHGNRYKYRIYGCGQLYYKSDPYASAFSTGADNSSVIRKKDEYRWGDSGWLNYRAKYQKNIASKPLNIYELHLGTWKNNGRGRVLNYKDYARELAPYVKQMGYTHVSLLPINEFLENDKAIYVPRGLFAPMAKYGTPDDLKAFVGKLHEAGVGVIFDIPIVSFLKEKFKLFDFNGMYYGHVDDERIKQFGLMQGSVKSLLLSCVSYWIKEYHADAIRISDVDELLGFYYNGDGNNIAKEFLADLVKIIKKAYPDVLLLADGNEFNLGFDLVFNNFKSERLLEYSSIEFENRKAKNADIFGLMEENSIGTVSFRHNIPTYKKPTFMEASAGDYWQKFAGLRALFGLMMTARGKKLCFMGNEIAQFKSWSADDNIEWFLLDFESHEKFQRYVAELNNFYLEHSALWQGEATDGGFAFVDRNTFEQGVAIFRRSSKSEELTVVINLSQAAFENFRIGAPEAGAFTEIFNSDEFRFNGSGVINGGAIDTQPIEYHSCKNSFVMRIPPLGISVLRFEKSKNSKK